MTIPEFDGDRCITKEGVRFEAKRARGGLPRDFWETYSSFANTDGGIIVLGVSEEDGVLMLEGVPDADGTVRNLWSTVNNPERVSVNLLSDSDVRIEEVDGRRIVVVDVPRADRRDRPVHLNGNARNSYRRRGDGDYKCRPEEIASMVSDSLDVATDRVPVLTSEVSDLDSGTIRAYRNSLRTLKPNHPWNGLDDAEFLRVLGASVESDGVMRPTLAGLLMFGQGYCIVTEVFNYFLDYRRYGMGDGWDYRLTAADGDWSGNLYDFFTRVMNSVRVEIGRSFSLDGDMRRVEDAPLDRSVRESLVNALVNADYRGRSGIAVELRPGSYSVRNPGTFRIPIGVAEGGGVSDPRNQTLATMFMLIGMVEHSGSGVSGIIAACREMGLPDPVFKEETEPDRVTVSLSLVPRVAGSGTLDGEVLRLLRQDGDMSMTRLAQVLEVPRSSVVGAVGRLRSEGLLERVGGNRGRWVVRDR